jgi:phosphomannomutase
MALITSVSGIRGTIGGKIKENLTPIDIVGFAAAYAQLITNTADQLPIRLVIGRDARISGAIVRDLVVATLSGMGIEIIDLGLSTTPTVEMAVVAEKAHGGIILTASHNPKQWNALKLLDKNGEFISPEIGHQILNCYQKQNFDFATVDNLGKCIINNNYLNYHIQQIISLPYIKIEKIKARHFRVAVDGINSVGSIAVPVLLNQLGIPQPNIIVINEQLHGDFAHNPEPLKENLTVLAEVVKTQKLDLGIAVDPDVDRLVLINETGEIFGEEYTLVAAADYVLKHNPGNTVSNLSSTRALRDLTTQYGQQHFATAVGEYHVVQEMKRQQAVIGGEGNGGVILPELHYGRDALVGIALILSYIAESQIPLSALRSRYTHYEMIKTKIELTPTTDIKNIINRLAEHYQNQSQTTVNQLDGIKIDLPDAWVHIRPSNTEPIIRIYAEAKSISEANELITEVQQLINPVI